MERAYAVRIVYCVSMCSVNLTLNLIACSLTTDKEKMHVISLVNGRKCWKSRLFLVRPLLQTQKRLYCDKISADEEKEREIERIMKNASLEDPPTACCRSGCANCVFIVWAEALSSKMANAGPEIADKIMKSVDDPSMKAYLELELRIRGLKKK